MINFLLRFAAWLLLIPLTFLMMGCYWQDPEREAKQAIIEQDLLNEVPSMDFEINAELGDKVIYLGLDIDKNPVKPGEVLTLTHYWKARKILLGWNVFVHLNGTKTGYINGDHIPLKGLYPIRLWKEGEIIRDIHKVTLPGDWSDDEVVIHIGLWKKGQRLEVVKGPHDDRNRIIVARIPVLRHQ